MSSHNLLHQMRKAHNMLLEHLDALVLPFLS
jgi:hypothetical protein